MHLRNSPLNENGQTQVEYALILVTVVIAVIGVASLLGDSVIVFKNFTTVLLSYCKICKKRRRFSRKVPLKVNLHFVCANSLNSRLVLSIEW